MITLHLKEMELVQMLSERLETPGSGMFESVNLKYLLGEHVPRPLPSLPRRFLAFPLELQTSEYS